MVLVSLGSLSLSLCEKELFFAGHSAINISFVFYGRSRSYRFQKHEGEKMMSFFVG